MPVQACDATDLESTLTKLSSTGQQNVPTLPCTCVTNIHYCWPVFLVCFLPLSALLILFFSSSPFSCSCKVERLKSDRYFCYHHLATQLISELWDVHLKGLVHVWFRAVFFDSKETVPDLSQNKGFLVVQYRKNILYFISGLKLVMKLYHPTWG